MGGGWDVCVAEPYKLVRPCLVYSIGYKALAYAYRPVSW